VLSGRIEASPEYSRPTSAAIHANVSRHGCLSSPRGSSAPRALTCGDGWATLRTPPSAWKPLRLSLPPISRPPVLSSRSPATTSPSSGHELEGAHGSSPENAALVPDGLVPIESPYALFVPETRLHSLQPLALLLPALLPGTVGTGSYERTASGSILHERDRVLRHALVIGGTRVDVTIDASVDDGLPTMFDWDILLGVFALIERGIADDAGVFPSVSLRAICEAAGRAANDQGLAATKRALRRFTGVRIRTHLQIEPAAANDALGHLYRSRAGAVPSVVQTEGGYWVLEAQLSTETFRETAGKPLVRETLNRLRLNPLWLTQARGGYTAWLHAELHWALQRAVSKRLLQVGTLAVARGDWRPGEAWELPLSTATQLLGIAPRAPARQLEAIEGACEELAQHDALQYEIVPKARRQEARLRLQLGPALLTSSFYRSAAPTDPAGLRALLWHLSAFGVRDQDARAWIQEDAGRVRDALRYVYWLQAEHGGRTSPTGRELVRNWAAFLRKAITGQWAYEPEYQAWVREVAAGHRSLDALASPMQPILGVPGRPTGRLTDGAAGPPMTGDGARPIADIPAPAAAAPPIAWPDDEWGRAAAQLAADDPAVAALWLEGSRLIEVSGDTLTVEARDTFAAEWIEHRLRGRLEALLSEQRGTPTVLQVTGARDR
jgi:hypothetical protein